MANFFSVDDPEKIKEIIKEKVQILNECLVGWYNKIFNTDVKDFTGCCDDTELEMLVECYNIFRKHNKNTPPDDSNIIVGLIKYYYLVVVLEYYVHSYFDKKFYKIANEEESRSNIIFTDNMNNRYVYRYRYSRYPKECIKIQDIDDEDTELYVSSENRGNDPYIYSDEDGKKKIILSVYNGCFEETGLNSKEIDDYVWKLTTSDDVWASDIRRNMMGFNKTKFEGHKGGKKNNKKTIKKGRKNKSKKSNSRRRRNTIKK